MDKPGIIIKISVKDFVTYTYAEMYPGPNLNMIIGPNGTGKSTMVAAIILGLGGNPKTVGRGTKISEYVKHHSNESRIDILLKGNGSNDSNVVTITRIFNLQDKSKWEINGKKVSEKDVLQHVKLYNIQVDNLCQFLPQDRVQDFAKMNKQELLKQTKKALCKDDLLEKQQNLITKTKQLTEFSNNSNKIMQKLQNAKDANMRLESKMKNLDKQKEYLDLIKNIDRKIAWLNYEELASKLEEIKDDKAHAADILATHKKDAVPIETAIKNAKKVAAKLKEELSQCSKNVNTVEDEIEKNKNNLNKSKESIKEYKSDMKSRIVEVTRREHEINEIKMKSAKLQSDRDDIRRTFGSDEDISRKLQQYNNEMRQISTQIGVIEEKKSELLTLKQEKSYEMRSLENELKKIENIKDKRLESLRRLDGDAHKATIWLRQNPQNFRGDVFEPMMLELNIINPENGVYLESTIPVRDRVALTCTNKEDMNLLIRLLRDRQKFNVNIVYSNPEQSVGMFQPKIPIERLRTYGLYAYLSSLLTGPSPIITYLCKTYGLHNTPVGNEKTNDCFEEIPKDIRCFFSNKFRFYCSFSKYSGEKVVRQTEIKSDGYLSISLDVARLENIRGKLQENQRCCENYDTLIQELKIQITQLNESRQRLSESVKQFKKVLQDIQMIESRINVANNNIVQLKQRTETEDDIKNETNSKIKIVIKQIIKLHKVIKEKFEKFSTLVTDLDVKQIKINLSEEQITFLENKASDIRQLCEEAANTLKKIETKYNHIKRDGKVALQKARDLSNGFAPDQEGFHEFRESYDLLDGNMEELERDKNILTGKMECLNTADENERRDYEERLQLIEQWEVSLKKDNVEIKNIDRAMGKMERDYLTPLEKLVNQISSRFSAAFERMGCAGEVTIYKGDKSNDYEQYGLSIKVTYRDGEPLQELNSFTQSGGEKAVATAVYMLSLQELTPVPFRCVDEINQGMDEINEKKIFELLFDSTSKPNTSQYFLITPKLIPNLNYVPSVKIHFIHNGPFVASQSEWNKIKL